MSLITAKFGDKIVEYQESEPVVERLKLAIIKHDFSRYGFGITYFPDVITVQNTGDPVSGGSKGNPVFVRSPWWRLIEKLNSHDERSYRYTRSIGYMWINTDYNQNLPYSQAQAVSVVCGGNFIAYDLETPTHVRIITFDNFLKADQVLDPALINWHVAPHKVWKACSVERNGTLIRKVAEGLDVYIPYIAPHAYFGKPAEMWIEKWKIEILGERNYSFMGGDAYVNGVLFRKSGVHPN